MSELTNETCVPCEGGVPPMTPEQYAGLLSDVPGWHVIENHHLVKKWTFDDFSQALAAVNAIGALAEQEGHHPDIRFGWGRLEVSLHTHAIDGLSRNDFILAAKINEQLG